MGTWEEPQSLFQKMTFCCRSQDQTGFVSSI